MAVKLLTALFLAFILAACAPRKDTFELVSVRVVEVERKPKRYEFEQDSRALWSRVLTRGYVHSPAQPNKPILGKMCVSKEGSSEDTKIASLKGVWRPRPNRPVPSRDRSRSWSKKMEQYKEDVNKMFQESDRWSRLRFERIDQERQREFEEEQKRIQERELQKRRQLASEHPILTSILFNIGRTIGYLRRLTSKP